ncbi:hypothetical protein AB205_0111630 [Aquarana catesbeiana]|uniref:Uncharacterized protein n=1 Tax=Aquarana catesbeiana TaxID=8400 RepID=A0A2G9Q9L9_AQUCT|nr:hypothetical protein AB205_0111630 [Aquarana catesbeiana]
MIYPKKMRTFVQNDQEIQDVPSDGDDTMSTKNQEDLLISSSSRQVFNSSTVGVMSSALLQCCADLQTIKDYTSSMISRL